MELRLCEDRDLLDLEWFGAFWAHRSIIREAYERQCAGENLMLLAIVNRFPIGQIWIDIDRYASVRGAYFWAFRVMAPFQNHGLGSHILSEAERFLASRGFLFAVVDADNRDARRMYERHGYGVLKRWRRNFSFVRPDGEAVSGAEWNWEMRKELPAVANAFDEDAAVGMDSCSTEDGRSREAMRSVPAAALQPDAECETTR